MMTSSSLERIRRALVWALLLLPVPVADVLRHGTGLRPPAYRNRGKVSHDGNGRAVHCQSSVVGTPA